MVGRPKGIPKTGGRQKGKPNKTTQAAKDAIAEAAQKLGGANRLFKWAKSDPLNERVFWGTIYPKLLPLTLSGDQDNPVRQIVEHAIRPIGANAGRTGNSPVDLQPAAAPARNSRET